MKGQDKVVNIFFCGTGGQGVLSAAEVCAWAALYAGFEVKKSEVHGMAQRGGSVESHLRFGKKVWSALIPAGEADYLVGFERLESLRLKSFLRKSGVDLTAALDDCRRLSIDKRQVNVFLLGRLSRELSIPGECWIRAIETVFAAKRLKENVAVFLKGREAGA